MITPSNITQNHRVLIGTPHNDSKNYCIDKYIENVRALSYKNYDVLIVDNSESRKNYKRFIKEGFKAIHVKPNNKPVQKFLAESHEEIRKYAIRHNYDYLLHWESDITSPTSNIIERLMIHNLPIVSAMYMIDYGSDSHLMAQKIESFGDLRETINVDNGSDLIMVDGKLKKTFHCGLGMVLIHKGVLNRFTFRHEEGASVHPDSFFAFDTDSIGIQKYIDTSILCEHDNRNFYMTDFE